MCVVSVTQQLQMVRPHGKWPPCALLGMYMLQLQLLNVRSAWRLIEWYRSDKEFKSTGRLSQALNNMGSLRDCLLDMLEMDLVRTSVCQMLNIRAPRQLRDVPHKPMEMGMTATLHRQWIQLHMTDKEGRTRIIAKERALELFNSEEGSKVQRGTR
jgi:hypothetical protein